MGLTSESGLRILGVWIAALLDKPGAFALRLNKASSLSRPSAGEAPVRRERSGSDLVIGRRSPRSCASEIRVHLGWPIETGEKAEIQVPNNNNNGSGGGKGGSGGSGGGSGGGRPPNAPSTTGNPSGGGRGNNPPRK